MLFFLWKKSFEKGMSEKDFAIDYKEKTKYNKNIRWSVRGERKMKHILVVDDSKSNLVMVKQELSDIYMVTPVTSGMQALQFLEKKYTDLILLDVSMPEMDGPETMRRIREREEWRRISIVFLTADSSPETETQCLADGADDFIAKPFVPQVMRSRIARILELNELRNDLEARLLKKSIEVELVTINSITAIAKTIEAKDHYTSGHSERVANFSAAIAKELGWDAESIKRLRYMALLHDIGKIGVPDSVLNKPEPLEEEELRILRNHPVVGGEILKDIHVVENVQYGALYHHERFDGKGYPEGLCGEAIPIEARVIAIADSFDAMASDRAYRSRLSLETIISELEGGIGTQFDPEIVQVFLKMLREGFTI